MSQYELSVGLEVHVELKTKTKMFCGCKNDPFGSAPNTNVCPVCFGLPGALPQLNQRAIEMTVELGQALGGQIATETFWARKNYFYPDLPKGYQVSQSTAPIVANATLEINGVEHQIERVHLEEDAGKLVHQGNKPYSLVNYNRAGVPLMELVTEPDFHSAESAKGFCQELQRVMRSLDVSDADMEKGQMRCEANISVRQKSEVKSQKLGTKVEVKNINSFRAVEKAIEYEFKRQTELLEDGKKISQDTRTWNNVSGETAVMRSKDTSADYRYFPEPDLPLVLIPVSTAKAHQLPDERRQAIEELGAPATIAKALVDKNLDARMLEIDGKSPKLAKEAAHLMLESPAFAGLEIDDQIKLIEAKQANGWTKETLFTVTNNLGQSGTIDALIVAHSTELDLTPVIATIIAAHSSAVADYKSGKENALNFLVGQVMAKAQGKANINSVRDELKQALSN